MLAVGLLISGRSSSIADFAVSGRNMSLAVCSLSIVASPAIFPEMPASFVAFWVSLAVSVTVSLATQKNDPPRTLTNADGEPIDLNDRFGTLPLFRRVEQ